MTLVRRWRGDHRVGDCNCGRNVLSPYRIASDSRYPASSCREISEAYFGDTPLHTGFPSIGIRPKLIYGIRYPGGLNSRDFPRGCHLRMPTDTLKIAAKALETNINHYKKYQCIHKVCLSTSIISNYLLIISTF